jgi:hypothetical protein
MTLGNVLELKYLFASLSISKGTVSPELCATYVDLKRVKAKVVSDYVVTPEAEFLVEKPGTKTGLLPGFFVFSSRHLLSGNARYFWSFASFSSRFLQFVSFSSCFEEGTRVSFSSRFVKSGYCFQVSDSE